MADRALRLSPPQPPDFIFPTFSNPRSWRFRKPRILYSRLHLLHCSSSHITIMVPFVPEKVTRPTRRRFGYRSGGGGGGDEEDNDGEEGWKERRTRGRRRRRRKRRRWWEELPEDDDDDGESTGILEQVVDNVWIFQVFRSYGYLLPFIVISFLLTTGPKALLMALAVAAGPSLLFLAFQKLTGRDKRRRKFQTSNLESEEEEEEEETRRRRRVGYYPSWARGNGSPAETGRGSDGSSKESSRGKASRFGGWDELDGLGPVPEPPRVTDESVRKPVGDRKKFASRKVRRERAEPLLLRLLVSLFPFLSSWTDMLW